MITNTHWQPDFKLLETLSYSFSSVTLEELGKARLMNRTDTKFLLPACQLPQLFDVLRDNYSWLEVDGLRLCPYETLYYDTTDLQLYLAHLTGRTNRYKVRQRHYTQSNLTFTEVKQKNQKNRTVKNRVRCPEWSYDRTNSTEQPSLDEVSRLFIKQQTNQSGKPLDPNILTPSLWVGYTRLTFVSNTSAERLTLDLNLTFQNQNGRVSFPNLLIAELKQDAQQPSAFSALMRQKHLRPGGISKYCLGMISLNPTLRNNRFRPQLKRLYKILDRT